MRGMGPGGLRLAPMSPRLAGYFGAKSGVLVLSAGNPALKLEDGDVVTAIGGRTPDSPMHAMRILHSYQPGEKVSLQVLRDRKSVSIEVTLPEHHGGMHGPGSRMERQDAPPAPTPAAPAPTHQH
jgi:S1-C subfamily serine protease